MNRTGPKNTAENMKHLLVMQHLQHVSNNPKNTAAVATTQKHTCRFSKLKTQNNTLLIPVCNIPSLPPGQYILLFDLFLRIRGKPWL